MNLPSSTAKPTTATSTSASSSDAVAEKSTGGCEGCERKDVWVLHTVRLRATLRVYCTHCLLRHHPTSFCPACFAFYDSSPPHVSRRVSCSSCIAVIHTHCLGDANPLSYLCPLCRDPVKYSFFRPIIGPDGSLSVDKPLSEAFYCAAKIAASSMNKAVIYTKSEAERRGKEASLAKRRAREAMEHVVMLDAKEKARPVIPKLKEASVELSANRVIDQKPKLSPASNGTLVKQTETSPTATTTKNNGATEKQNPGVQLAIVKQES